MKRWWYLEDKNNKANESAERQRKSKNVSARTGVIDRKWKLSVLVTKELYPGESIAVTGDCDALGNWDPEHCTILQLDEGHNNIWSVELNVPANQEIGYRYLIYSVDPNSENIHIRRWETHLKPRVIPADNSDYNNRIDTFGEIDGAEKIDRGWLTTDTVIQFKLYDNPFALKDRIKNKVVYVKLTPMNLRVTNESHVSAIEESLSNDTRENAQEQSAYAFTEFVKINYLNCRFMPQEQFGCPYNPNDYILFNVTVAEPENVAYLIDLYTYSSRADSNELPYHLGYHYILPNLLKKSDGELELPITCATKHRPLGMMKISFLKITPFMHANCDMSVSYIRYWNTKWQGLDVGHRGSGTSFKAIDGNVIRENTIASLKKAGAHGADMVEFDVQLSKDLVPVIYHDFHVYVSLKKKTTFEINDMLELPMRELTLEQLKNLKVYHIVEGKSREPKFFDEDLAEHQPFPQLSEALDVIDENIGFNIEVKWSMQYKDGSMEADLPIDKNLYVDCILDVVMARAPTRRIVFSCFDPDICTMLRLKQNLYPVMFLTLGVTSKYPSYRDPRCNTIESAVSNACAMELLGIVAHTEDLLRDHTQVNLATDKGLVIFCWGDDNNSKDTIKYLKELGIHAIIYDKMDVLSTKGVKESVFSVGTKDTQNDLINLKQFEIEKQLDQQLGDVIRQTSETF